MATEIIYSDYDLDTRTWNVQVRYKEHILCFDYIKMEHGIIADYELVECLDEYNFPVTLPLSDCEINFLLKAIQIHIIFQN
jgi:hypothetical protein